MSGLEVTGSLGDAAVVLGHQQQLELHQIWSTFEGVLAQVSSWGFPPMQRPNYTMPMITPDELVNMDNRAYTEVYARVVEWLNYAEDVQSRIQSVILETKNQLSRVEVEIRRATISAAHAKNVKKPAKEYIDTLIEAHPRVITLTHELQKVQQQKASMESNVSKLTRFEKLISRSIELRRLTIEGTRVGGNITGRPGGLHQAHPYNQGYGPQG